MRLHGTEAINYAEANGLAICKYNDPIEAARENLSADEARAIALEDPRLIYIDTVYDVDCSSYNSAGIQTVAANLGASRMRRIAAGERDGVAATLFGIPCNSSEIRVLDTNADPVWEEEDAAAFAETLAWYGIEAEHTAE